MSKYYFLGEDDERCYNLKWIIDYMREGDICGQIKELKVFEAKIVYGEDFFIVMNMAKSVRKDIVVKIAKDMLQETVKMELANILEIPMRQQTK